MNPIECNEARPLLAAYADGELELPRALALERHLDGCAACGAAVRTLRATGKAVRSAPYHRAPDALRRQLGARLRELAPPAAAVAEAAVPAPRRRRVSAFSRWAMPLAASLALAVGVDTMLALQRTQNLLAGELVAGHVRSLQVEHLADVASSDQHTVKPWFAGKLDYSPPVRDLAAQDFPLAGGRLDYVEHRNVAALVYRHRKHIINLYVWPAADGAGNAPVALRSSEGYNLAHWSAEGMDWWAVSDLNAQELRQFAGLQIAAAKDQAANEPNR